jgi:integrase
MAKVALLKLKYVNEYRDRTGKLRRYFRRGGKTLGALPGDVGSDEFMSAYQGFLADQVPVAAPRNSEGTFGRLINEYYGSRPFLNLKPSSRQIYRYVLEPLAKAHGHRMVRDMRADKVSKIIQDIGETKPGMANLTRSVLQKMMKYAVKMKWRADNPVAGVEPFKGGTHHSWTEGELKTFEGRWPLGTRQRLAYALLLYTAQRVGDVAKMVRADMSEGTLHVIQQKTGAELYLPVLGTRTGNARLSSEGTFADRQRERQATDTGRAISPDASGNKGSGPSDEVRFSRPTESGNAPTCRAWRDRKADRGGFGPQDIARD